MNKKVLRIVVWTVVIAGLLLTTHVLVNYFDLPGFLRTLHGG